MSNNQLPPDSGNMLTPGHGADSGSAMSLRPHTFMGTPSHWLGRNDDDDIIDLHDLWRMLMAHKWSLLAIMLTGLIAALLMSFISTPTYQASTTLQVDRRAATVVSFGPDVPDLTSDFDERTGMGTYLELLNSRTLAERVIDELHLDRIGLREMLNVSAIDADAEMTGEDARIGNGSLAKLGGVGEFWKYWLNRIQRNWKKIRTPSVMDEEKLSDEALLDAFRQTVHAEQVRNSRMMRISVDNPDPELAASIANTMAEGFISLNLDRRFEASSYAKSFLDEQLEITKAKLEESERLLNKYASDHNIMTLDDESNPLDQTFVEYSSALVRAEQERIKFEAEYQSIRNAPNTAVQVLTSNTIQAYKTQRSLLDAEYQEKSKIYKDSYPTMLQLRAQMEGLNTKIQAEIESIRQSIANQLAAARQQEEKIRAQVAKTRAQITAGRDDEVNYKLLKREVDTNRELYDGLLQQFKEVGVAGGVEANNIQVVDKAEVPLFPYKPKFVLNAGIGLLAGMVFGLVIIFLREAFDDSVKSVNDLEKNFDLPVLGVIPNIKRRKSSKALAFLTYKYPRGRLAEAYRSLRTALQFTSPDGAPTRIVVTSTTNMEGKSTTALSLAINFAQLGVKVALIDADMRNPMVHEYFGIDNSSGLSSYLSGRDAKGTMFNSNNGDVENLTVITSGPVPPNPVELLNGPKFAELLDALMESGCEQIIIDGPPVLGLADAVVLGKKVVMLYVTRANATRLNHIKTALRRLRMSGVIPIGFVLTRASAVHNSYYAQDSYYGYGAFPVVPIEPRSGRSALPG